MGNIEKYIITASGGPFLEKSLEDFNRITIEQTLKHPNWSMGAKISVDSATMANKGLELIEAKILFNLENHQIDAIIHPQSFIHGIVHFHDGSYKMYACAADMRIPIAASLNYGAYHKNHYANKVALETYSNLSFKPIDAQRFPCFFLAQKAMYGHHLLPACFNAANEVAVQSYLDGEIRFIDIAIIIENVIDYVNHNCFAQETSITDLSSYLVMHQKASDYAYEEICKIKKT
jgi:1-deoxy-D-xylulose-5-phosphate reductoisomerase